MSDIHLLSGLEYFVRGVRKMFEPGLRRYVMFPLVLNVLVMATASWWLFSVITDWVQGFIDWLPSFMEWLYWILLPLAIFTLVLSSAYLFSSLLIIIASPLNGLLSEKVEQSSGIQIPDEALAKMAIRAIFREFRKVLYYVPRYLLIFALLLVPGVNIIVPVLLFLFGGWMAALQYVDYSFDNHQRAFSYTKTSLSENKLLALSFGITVSLLMTIPVVNWFVMPAAVIGATLMRVERLRLDPFDPLDVGYANSKEISPELAHDRHNTAKFLDRR